MTNTKHSSAAIAILLAGVVALAQCRKKEEEITREDIRREFKEAITTTKEYVAQEVYEFQKDQAVKELEELKEVLDQKIYGLEHRLKKQGISDDAKGEVYRLKRCLRTLDRQIDRTREAVREEWADVRKEAKEWSSDCKREIRESEERIDEILKH